MATLPIASDHAGYELKEFLKTKLAEAGYSLRDFGAYSAESVDYPDIAHSVCSLVDKGQYPCAVLICGTGNGMCMTANKYPNIRAGLCWSKDIAELIRRHNDANVICLPGRFIEQGEALKAVMAFLTTAFEGGRHERRISKIPLK
ncbi:MAG TPA: ribose 5-phosphate isomerase B [Bacteroidales bacterium]|nr:ribose 5-phosphate isomerase B [Bacteroidales bacterium]HPT01284.1 ribose 5-phosphate isomerase B [Bacteroidales bacterium]